MVTTVALDIRDFSEKTKCQMAKETRSKELLDALSYDSSEDVRFEVAINKNISKDTKKRLTHDESVTVRIAADVALRLARFR